MSGRPFSSYISRDAPLIPTPDLQSEEAWRARVPAGTIGNAPTSTIPVHAPPDTGAVEGTRLREEGIACASACVAIDDVVALQSVVRALRNAGHPPVFAWLFDQAWTVACGAGMRSFMDRLLGTGWVLLPRVWVHAVPVVRGARGWPPHVEDAARVEDLGEGVPDRLTAWIAVTDAHVDSGCIHAVPGSHKDKVSQRVAAEGSFTSAQVAELLHGVRAYPVPAGGVLAWNWRVLHWGGPSTGESAEPRVALSLEARHAHASPRPGEQGTIAPQQPPPFHERLKLVAGSILVFASEDREPAAARYRPWAEQFLSSVA